MNSFSTAVQSTKEKYDKTAWLGLVSWFSVGNDSTLDFESLTDKLDQAYANMPELKPDVPNMPRSVDIFKRACTSAEFRKAATQNVGVFYNVVVRNSGQDTDQVWRNFIREEVDGVGHELSYRTLCKVIFTRSTGRVRFETDEYALLTNPTDREAVDLVKKTILDYLDTNKATITAMSVRSFIRNYLENKLHSIQVRESGGVHFVTRGTDDLPYADALEAFETVLNGLGDVSVSIHSLVLLDDSKQREMIRVAFESESVDEVDRMIAQISDALKDGGTVTAGRYADYKSQYDTMRSKIVEFSDLVDEKMEETGLRLDIMNAKMSKLLGAVKTSTLSEDDL